MKWVALSAIIAVLSSACTITVKPLPEPQKKHSAHSRSRSHRSVHSRAPHPKPEQPQQRAYNVKETWWIENYHKLESAHGDYTIPADANIQPLSDGRFKVPDAVLSHYQDLLLTKPTPKP